MKIQLIDYTENSIQKLATVARISHNSTGDSEDNIKLMKKIVKWGHYSVLEHAYATFKVEGISRACSHQMIRHRHLSFVEKSLRYTEPNDIIIPNNISDGASYRSGNLIAQIKDFYFRMVNNNIPKEDARFILPMGTGTKLMVTGNFRAWREFLQKRLIPQAQWEIRDLAGKIKEELISISDSFLFD